MLGLSRDVSEPDQSVIYFYCAFARFMFEVLKDIAQKNVWGALLALTPLFDCTTDPFLTVIIYVGVLKGIF